MMQIAQILTLPDGCPVTGIQGQVTKQFPPKSGQAKRAWTFTVFKVNDGTGEAEIKMWNRPPMQLVGMNISISPGEKPDNLKIKRDNYQGKATLSVDVQDRANILINGQPLAAGAPPSPAPAYQAPPAAYVPPPVAYQSPSPAYQPPPPVAYNPPPPQTYPPAGQPSPAYQPAPPPLGATDFGSFISQVAGEETAANVRKRINEIAGLHHDCLKAAHYSLKTMYEKTQIEFGPSDVCSVAATILIQLTKIDAVTGKGFGLPAPVKKGPPVAPPQQTLPMTSDNDGEDAPPF